MRLLVGVLLAFGYYGVRSVTEAGLGRTILPAFYLLALVFVVELSRSPSLDARSLVRAVGLTAVFGTLVILTIEGGVYLWERPEPALEDFQGVAVLAIPIVVAALVSVLYLSAIETSLSNQISMQVVFNRVNR